MAFLDARKAIGICQINSKYIGEKGWEGVIGPYGEGNECGERLSTILFC